MIRRLWLRLTQRFRPDVVGRNEAVRRMLELSKSLEVE